MGLANKISGKIKVRNLMDGMGTDDTCILRLGLQVGNASRPLAPKADGTTRSL